MNKIFLDMLLSNGGQTITGDLKCQHLTCNSLHTNSINTIPFEEIYLRNSSTIVKGIKQFSNITAKTVVTNFINQVYVTSCFLSALLRRAFLDKYGSLVFNSVQFYVLFLEKCFGCNKFI